jgi:demethylmenaquinone methyltransferase/2-methoxy-6-polyprenyl-1,4-benzoquinol methylase
VSDMDDVVRIGHLFGRWREPTFRAAIEALELPAGNRGLDASCGAGLQTLLLGEVVGPAGHVIWGCLTPWIFQQHRWL